MPTKIPAKKKKASAKNALKKERAAKKPKPEKAGTKHKTKKKPIEKNTIPLKFPFGGTEFSGYLKPLEKLTPWGIPESYEIHLKGQDPGIISIATGVWVIQEVPNVPQQITDAISKSIEAYYNKKNKVIKNS